MGAGEVTITALTHRGAVRAENEDAVVAGPIVGCASMTSPAICTLPAVDPVVVAVADGIGGQVAGDIASEHVARRLAEVGALLTQLVESSTVRGELVVDPFAGVSSTLVAAILSGRRAWGVEVEERYARIALERVLRAEEVARSALSV